MRNNLDYPLLYLKKFKQILTINKNNLIKLLEIKKILLTAKRKDKKVFIFGNGGSASIASHFSVDLTTNCNIKCHNFNEANLITCLSNDFGYKNWITKSLSYFAKKDDILILVSSSGKSNNMIEAFKFAKKNKLKIITFTGFNKNNRLNKMSQINIWIDSQNYNFIENAHQILLLLLVDWIKNNNF